MNKQLIKEVLEEDAERNISTGRDLWPSVHKRVQSSGRSRLANPQRSRMLPLFRSLLATGVVVAILVGMGTMAGLIQPEPVSAAEVLARAEQAVSAPGIRSFHGVWPSQWRDESTEPYSQSQSESWYLAPSSRRSEGHNTGHDGQEERSLLVQDGEMIWLYMAGHNQVVVKDRDNTIPVFGNSNLETLTGQRWLKDFYEPELVGSEEVMGRNAYVLEFTLKPRDQWPPDHFPSHVARMKYWVDGQAYFVLKMMSWDAEGNELSRGGFTSFEIDAPVDPALFRFAPPTGAQVLDSRTAGVEELNTLWKQTAQQLPFRLYRPTNWLSEDREGRPYYDAAQGVVTQGFPRANRGRTNAFEIQMPVITQRAASNKGLQGSGEPIKVGNLTGVYTRSEGRQILTIERDGTEIIISLLEVQGGSDMLGRMIEIAESLQPVQK